MAEKRIDIGGTAGKKGGQGEEKWHEEKWRGKLFLTFIFVSQPRSRKSTKAEIGTVAREGEREESMGRGKRSEGAIVQL